jgi:hypothetical protein
MEYEFLCKTFRCCIDEDCDNCPLYDFEMEHCEKQIKLQALSFIILQQAEIEKLKKVGNKIDSLGAAATLIDMKERLAHARNEWEREVRAEAVREFAEIIVADYPEMEYYLKDIVKEIQDHQNKKEGADNA